MELASNKIAKKAIDFFKSEKAWLIFVFILSFTLRLIYMHQSQSNPVYLDRTSRLPATESWFVTHAFWRPVIFSYFTRALFNLAYRNFTILQVCFYALGSINCLLIYVAAKKVFNVAIAKIASFIASIYGTFIFFEAEFCGSESVLAVFLGLIFFLLVLDALKEPTRRRWIVCGAVGSLATLCRHHFFLFGLAALLYIIFVFLRDKKNKEAITYSACFLLGFLAVLGPITLRNVIIGKAFVVSNYNASYSFWSANSPDYEKMVDAGYDISNFLGWEEAISEPYREAGHWVDGSEYSRYFYKKTFDFIFNHPIRWLKLMAKKFFVFWSGFERIEIGNYIYANTEYSRLLATLVSGKGIFYPFGIIGPLSIIGAALSMRNSRNALFLTIMIFSCMVLDILQIASPRYRISVVPFMIIAASYTLYWWAHNVSDRKWTKDLFISIIFFLILVLLCNVPPPPLTQTSRAVMALKKGWGYVHMGKTSQAIDEIEKAIAVYPGKPDYRIYEQLADLYMKEKKIDKSIEAHEKAMELKPEDMKLHMNLARIFEKTGRMQKAVSEYRIVMDSKKVRFDLAMEASINAGLLSCRMKDYEPAIKAFNLVVSRGKNNRRYLRPVTQAYYNLAEIYETTGDTEKAISEYQELLKLSPDNFLARKRIEELHNKQTSTKR